MFIHYVIITAITKKLSTAEAFWQYIDKALPVLKEFMILKTK